MLFYKHFFHDLKVNFKFIYSQDYKLIYEIHMSRLQYFFRHEKILNNTFINENRIHDQFFILKIMNYHRLITI